MRLVFCLAALAFIGPAATAQTPADSVAIGEANRLGRMLYAYDQAAWHGTDAAMPLLQAAGDRIAERSRFYVVEPDGAGWRVAFGRIAPDSSAFLVAYEARLDSAYTAAGTDAFDVPVARTGFSLDAARALDAVMARFRAPQPVRYNTAVLPGPDGQVYVYVLPSQPATDVFYVGADIRYTFSPSAGRITEEKPLHTALLTMDLRDHHDAVTMSSAVLTDVPAETDVFYSISRPTGPVEVGAPPRVHHFVLTQTHVFLLTPSGVASDMTREGWERVMRMQDSDAAPGASGGSPEVPD